ncbi:MAG TPA: murein biosynthesis integral membrane protein MurJ [Thermohalobaculum sp.]|nr:murein biosynthesis integral membrane protein MurJ [Thermohalobaculum sp.]
MNAAPIQLLRSFATVGGWTMASRVLGFIRDIMIAAFLGAGPVAEAFFVAFRLPNMFRRFFAEGAFNMAFVPLFAKKLEGDGAAVARQFAEEAMSALLTALIVLTVIAQLAMPWFVLALASGFDDDGKLDLAVTFSRVVFPYIVFISLAALYSGILNSFGKFAAAAAAPVLLNVILIAVMALASGLGWAVGPALSWGVFGAGIAQLGLLVWATRRAGMTLTLRMPRLTPEVRRLVALGVPAALAGGVMQINLVVGTQVASYFDGAVSWLWYADRVYQLPLGVVGVAIGVVLLPELSRRVRSGDAASARDAMNRAAEFCLALTLPATVALIVVPGQITSVLFEHGAFTASDTAATAAALAIYAVGLPAFVLQKVLQPAYFAREDTRTPLRYAVVSMAVNLVIAVGGAPFAGYLAAAIGTTVAGWVNLTLLWRGVRQFGDAVTIDARLAASWPRILGASLAMGILVLGLSELQAAMLPGWRAVGLAVIVVVGAVAYAAAAVVFGAFRMSDIRAAMSRGKLNRSTSDQ